ncbi:uncharacterized protein LOC118436137 [Folsomia candida]|uniref:Uncharacterized protein n=1 Tax=Folsomia candida TaxID=158441 RepID=A0A226E2B6_FOLCA|nr:uncharacterized protein LOC118436137 [Folsomia candida]OXA51569.1 hypothetical protein Fcan01_12958 [Folsomia candida]
MLYASIIFEMANNLGKFPHIAILIIITIFTLVSGNINLVDQEVTWILNLQRPSGCIPQNVRNPQQIVNILPYVTNLALKNVLRVNTSGPTLAKVKKYLEWYIANLNADGTIYDHHLDTSDTVVSNLTADSTDSYAATYLSLVKSYLDASGDRGWVSGQLQQLKKIANAIWITYNETLRLTYAKPNYKEYYLMDNVEVWKGLEDYGIMLADLDNPDSEHYHYRAELIRNGIYYNLWNAKRNEYQAAYYKDAKPIYWNQFYANTTSNMWPMVFKLPDAMLGDKRAAVYNKFKANWLSRWTTLKADDFPWVALWEIVKLNESRDESSKILNDFKRNVFANYYPNRQHTWHIGESASFAVLLAEQF